MKLCVNLPMKCIDSTLLQLDYFLEGEGPKKKKKDESSSQFGMVQYMVIPFAILQSGESEGSDLFISWASSAREH